MKFAYDEPEANGNVLLNFQEGPTIKKTMSMLQKKR